MTLLLIWYKDGLRFTCTRCGHCCTGEPSCVRVVQEDVQMVWASPIWSRH